MNHVLPGIEQGRVNQSILVNVQRSLAIIERSDNAQPTPALRRRETLLFMSRSESSF
jgi:hypothetical protein